MNKLRCVCNLTLYYNNNNNIKSFAVILLAQHLSLCAKIKDLNHKAVRARIYCATVCTTKRTAKVTGMSIARKFTVFSRIRHRPRKISCPSANRS